MEISTKEFIEITNHIDKLEPRMKKAKEIDPKIETILWSAAFGSATTILLGILGCLVGWIVTHL